MNHAGRVGLYCLAVAGVGEAITSVFIRCTAWRVCLACSVFRSRPSVLMTAALMPIHVVNIAGYPIGYWWCCTVFG